MTMNKQFFVDYLLKTPTSNKGHHLVGYRQIQHSYVSKLLFNFFHCNIYIFVSCLSSPHICVLFIGYANRKTCGNANIQPCRDCTK